MKRIEAIVRTFRVADVKKVLTEVGVVDFIETEVKYAERHTEPIWKDYPLSFVPKVKIEVVVGDEDVDAIVEAIRQADQHGRRRDEDGSIAVFAVEQCRDIQTGMNEVRSVAAS
jgi:nitrogen regulatory protein P-II 1